MGLLDDIINLGLASQNNANASTPDGYQYYMPTGGGRDGNYEDFMRQVALFTQKYPANSKVQGGNLKEEPYSIPEYDDLIRLFGSKQDPIQREIDSILGTESTPEDKRKLLSRHVGPDAALQSLTAPEELRARDPEAANLGEETLYNYAGSLGLMYPKPQSIVDREQADEKLSSALALIGGSLNDKPAPGTSWPKSPMPYLKEMKQKPLYNKEMKQMQPSKNIRKKQE